MVILVVDGPRKGEVFHLVGDAPVPVGRYGTIALGDDRASRRHARFVPQDDGWFLEDLGSTNGTFINHQRVIYATRLSRGDAIQIGGTTLIVAEPVGDTVDPAPATNLTDTILPDHNHTPSADDLATDAIAGPAPGIADDIAEANERIGAMAMEDLLARPHDVPGVAPANNVPAAPRLRLRDLEHRPRARAHAQEQTADTSELPARNGAIQRVAPQPLAMPGGYAPDAGPLGTMRRWLPVAVIAVLILAVGALFMLYHRSQQALDQIQVTLADIGQRDSRMNADMLDAMRREIRTSGQEERSLLLQEMAGMLHERDEKHAAEREEIRQLVLELRSRSLPPEVPAVAVAPEASPESAPTESAAPRQAVEPVAAEAAPTAASAPDLARPDHVDAVFVVDATGALFEGATVVREEIIRELARLRLDERAWVVLVARDGLFEFRPESFTDMAREQHWPAALSGLGDDALVRNGPVDLRQGIERGMGYGPRQMFLLSDTLGASDGATRYTIRQSIQNLNAGGAMTVHALQFFSRAGREDLKSIATENGGTYTFIAAPPSMATSAADR